MKVSVGMTTYKNIKYLKEQLDSIFAQTVLPDEIVLCDDASPDDTFEYVKELQKNAPPIISFRVYRNEKNVGYVENFEKVFSLCRGDVIISCDADDVWMPNKVERTIEEFEKDAELLLLFHDATVIDGDGNFKHESVNDRWDKRLDKADSKALLHMAIQRKGIPNGMVMAFRKELLDVTKPFYGSHDLWLIMVAPLYGKVNCISDKLACYRRHENNTSNNTPKIIKRVKQYDRGKWFLHPDWVKGNFKAYYDRYIDRLDKDTKELLIGHFAFLEELSKVVDSTYGGIRLLKLYLNGSFAKFRGNRNTFLLDEFYLMVRLFVH